LFSLANTGVYLKQGAYLTGKMLIVIL